MVLSCDAAEVRQTRPARPKGQKYTWQAVFGGEAALLIAGQAEWSQIIYAYLLLVRVGMNKIGELELRGSRG